MNLTGASQEIEALAQRMIWWKEAQDALRCPDRLLAQVMALGTWTDVQLAKRYWPAEAFLKVLQNPPTGVFDGRSWAYWHAMFKVSPVPPLPQRKLP